MSVPAMDFFDAVKARRSIRKFKEEPIPDEAMERALDAALLAPNSSNMQTWDFYWVRSAEKKAALVEHCMKQSAARTAAELVVITADPALWRRSNPEMVKFVEEVNAPGPVKDYYRKLIPVTYRWGPFNALVPLKWLTTALASLKRPITRGPHSRRDLQEVAIKSAALAAENFVLALAAQGYGTCMMEGFDEPRVKRMLGLGDSCRVVMVVAAGLEAPRATWGPQFRLPKEKVVHRV
jgi:nitroreductase